MTESVQKQSTFNLAQTDLVGSRTMRYVVYLLGALVIVRLVMPLLMMSPIVPALWTVLYFPVVIGLVYGITHVALHIIRTQYFSAWHVDIVGKRINKKITYEELFLLEYPYKGHNGVDYYLAALVIKTAEKYKTVSIVKDISFPISWFDNHEAMGLPISNEMRELVHFKDYCQKQGIYIDAAKDEKAPFGKESLRRGKPYEQRATEIATIIAGAILLVIFFSVFGIGL